MQNSSDVLQALKAAASSVEEKATEELEPTTVEIVNYTSKDQAVRFDLHDKRIFPKNPLRAGEVDKFTSIPAIGVDGGKLSYASCIFGWTKYREPLKNLVHFKATAERAVGSDLPERDCKCEELFKDSSTGAYSVRFTMGHR